jgi:thiol-disulfide isomerase/thioredoxin
MKLIINYCIFFSLMLLSFSSWAQESKTKRTFLFEGDSITSYPRVEWLKGEPITNLDKGKIYIIEMWATWCVPCIAAMPHLNSLNEKFKDRGVVFIAQDIMEGAKSKVEQFLAGKGSGMQYRVAFAGMEGSDFDFKWVKPAAVTSIPRTFIIQNNILVWQTTPDMLNEEVIQMLLDGNFTIDKAKALVKKTH